MLLYRLTGPAPARSAALELLHTQALVMSVWEAADWIDVAVTDLPDMPWPGGVRWEPLPEPDPITGLEDDRAIYLAADLLVRPPWVPCPEGFRGVDLVVPRGGAFGSGEHGSTAAALKLLHRTWCGRVGSDGTRAGGAAGSLPPVADVGCGSGILLAYCCGRGATQLQACDIDPASVRAAAELMPTAKIHLGGPEVLVGPVPWVIANMTGAELAGAWGGLMDLWVGPSEDGVMLVSGLRRLEVQPCIERMGRDPTDREVDGDFTALVWG